MNILVKNANGIHLTLSRRNLLTLIKMLDQKVGEPTLKRSVDDFTTLRVTAEEDEQHYKSISRQSSVQSLMGVGPEHVKDGHISNDIGAGIPLPPKD